MRMGKAKRQRLLDRVQREHRDLTATARKVQMLLYAFNIYKSRITDEVRAEYNGIDFFDFVHLRSMTVVIACDDFAHGWQFDRWKHEFPAKTRRWIQSNREEVARMRRRFVKRGFRVIKVWEHNVRHDPIAVAKGIRDAVKERQKELAK